MSVKNYFNTVCNYERHVYVSKYIALNHCCTYTAST